MTKLHYFSVHPIKTVFSYKNRPEWNMDFKEMVFHRFFDFYFVVS
jgi:hypothetical protein